MTPKVLELGYTYLSSLGLPELARPYMARLADEINEGVSIAVLDGVHSVNVSRMESTGLVRITVPVGTRQRAYSNSMGRVLLAALSPEELDRYFERAEIVPLTARTVTDPARLRRMLASVKANGYALVDQELEPGLIALAVPLHDVTGKVVAAMNVTTHAYRADLRAVQDRYLPPLRAAAQLIDEALRSAPWVH